MLKAIKIGERIIGFFSEPKDLENERKEFEGKMDSATHSKHAQIAKVDGKSVLITHDSSGTQARPIEEIDSLI